MAKSCIVLQSGGPTSVINASLYGVIKEAKKHIEISNLYGALNGIDGLLNNRLINLFKQDDKEISRLLYTPSAILGTVRHFLPNDFNNKTYELIYNQLVKYDIGYFILIGGNDSMDTINKLSTYLKLKEYDCKFIGVCKTIDNDLVLTDHTPGYGSAIKYIATTISEIKEDTSCYENGRVTIVELMGRDAGWLTAGSKLASVNGNGPDLIYLPEVSFNIDAFLNDVKKIYDKNKKVLVAISEGIKDENNEYILKKYKYLNDNDVFGHMQLGGASSVLASIVHEKLNLPVRSIELNLPQRCASHIGSLTDINEAKNCGIQAIRLLIKNESGKMVAIKRVSDNPYKVKYVGVNLNDVANKVKEFPSNWIINGNDISNEYIKYAMPLIKGTIKMEEENGIVRYAKLNKTIVKK